MTIKYVTVENLNLRAEPMMTADVLGSLHLAQEVMVDGPARDGTWLPVRAEIGGKAVAGFVSSAYLRDPLAAPRERLIGLAVAEWLKFDRGTRKENQQPFVRYVGDYWRALNIAHDGLDRDQPWSAAFISYLVRRAGGYEGFHFAASHSRYVHQAIAMRERGMRHPFWGFRISEHRPAPGDLVCRWRGAAVTYDDARKSEWFQSHCDIVAGIAENHALAIGGNVSDSVSLTRYPIDNDGYLTGEGKVYAILGNNSDQIDPIA